MVSVKEIVESKFIRPSRQEAEHEHEEVIYQLPHHSEPWVTNFLHYLENPKNYLRAIQNGKVRLISPQEALHNILNTGEYYRFALQSNPTKIKRVKSLFKDPNTKVSMPIVLYNVETNEKYLLAGHHRLTYNSQVLKHQTPALHLEYRK